MNTRKAIVVCGNAGAGKSTHARKLAAEQNAVLLDIDTCTERLARLVMNSRGHDSDDRDSPEFKRLLRAPIYETLFDIALDNLHHSPCVIVGPFTSERRIPDWPVRLAERLQASIQVVVVHCDAAERRLRLIERGNPRDVQKLADWQSYAAVGVDPTSPPFEHTFIDTTHRRSG